MAGTARKLGVRRLCSNGCGREAYVRVGIGQLCQAATQKPDGWGCRGMCRYECAKCKHVWKRPEATNGAHGCHQCHHLDEHKLLGRAPESEQIYG